MGRVRGCGTGPGSSLTTPSHPPPPGRLPDPFREHALGGHEDRVPDGGAAPPADAAGAQPAPVPGADRGRGARAAPPQRLPPGGPPAPAAPAARPQGRPHVGHHQHLVRHHDRPYRRCRQHCIQGWQEYFPCPHLGQRCLLRCLAGHRVAAGRHS